MFWRLGPTADPSFLRCLLDCKYSECSSTLLFHSTSCGYNLIQSQVVARIRVQFLYITLFILQLYVLMLLLSLSSCMIYVSGCCAWSFVVSPPIQCWRRALCRWHSQKGLSRSQNCLCYMADNALMFFCTPARLFILWPP